MVWVRCVTVNAFHLLASSDKLVKVKLLWLVWTNEEDAWCILAINRSLGKSVAVLYIITLNYTVQKVKKSRGLSNNAWDFRLLCWHLNSRTATASVLERTVSCGLCAGRKRQKRILGKCNNHTKFVLNELPLQWSWILSVQDFLKPHNQCHRHPQLKFCCFAHSQQGFLAEHLSRRPPYFALKNVAEKSSGLMLIGQFNENWCTLKIFLFIRTPLHYHELL